jgi:hypothetical protein
MRQIIKIRGKILNNRLKLFTFHLKPSLLAILSAFIFLFSACQVVPEQYIPLSETTDWQNYLSQNEPKEGYRYYYEALNNAQKAAYLRLLSGMAAFEEKIDIPVLSEQELTQVLTAVSYDNPELFSYRQKWTHQTGGKSDYLIPVYAASQRETELKITEMMLAAKKIADVANTLPSNFEKELYIHDEIAKLCQYETNAVEDVENYPYAYTAFGALVEGKAVCEGYSRAFQLVLTMCGIKNHLVVGKGTNNEGITEGHMWNLVFIDGEKYNVDLTWNDPKGADGVIHDYFNITDAQLSLDHSEFDTASAGAVSTAQNYFVKTQKYFETYDNNTKNAIGKLLSELETAGKDSLEIRFATKDVFDAAKKALFDKQEIYLLVTEATKNFTQKVDGSQVYYSESAKLMVMRIGIVFG